MRIKLYTAFACSSVLLLLMSSTGYAIAIHDDAEVLVKIITDTPAVLAPEKAQPRAHVRGNINSEKPNKSLLTDGVEFDVDSERVVLEPARPRTAAGTVSKWLEARANEHDVTEDHSHNGDCSHKELAFVPDMVLGGGWCDLCGCWMRHGCDPNGNCGIGHLEVCGSGNCSLHPYQGCRNSG